MTLSLSWDLGRHVCMETGLISVVLTMFPRVRGLRGGGPESDDDDEGYIDEAGDWVSRGGCVPAHARRKLLRRCGPLLPGVTGGGGGEVGAPLLVGASSAPDGEDAPPRADDDAGQGAVDEGVERHDDVEVAVSSVFRPLWPPSSERDATACFSHLQNPSHQMDHRHVDDESDHDESQHLSLCKTGP